MSQMVFVINLKTAHQQSGLTRYRVAKDTGLSHNTVSKYVEADTVQSKYLPSEVVRLATYLGVDWRDPEIVHLIEVEG